MKTYLLYFFLLLFQISFAHKNVIVEKEYGNIFIRTSTGFYTEEINKGLIVGQYAQKVASELNYTGRIEILLYQELKDEKFYTYYISEKDDSEDGEALIIMLHLNTFQIRNCLNVVEYSIVNHKKLKKGSSKLQSIYKALSSNRLMTILEQKIGRPDEVQGLKRDYYFTYYYYNNQFHFIKTAINGNQHQIKSCENLLDFHIVNPNILAIVTETNSIEILDVDETNTLKIENASSTYFPFKYNLMGEDKLLIEFHWMSSQSKRVLVYNLTNKVLIQDLDKISQ